MVDTRGPRDSTARRSGRSASSPDRGRKLDPECGPVRAGPLDVDAAAIRRQELTGDGQADPGPARSPGHRIDGPGRIGPIEPLEDVRDIRRRDPCALVAHADDDDGSAGCGAEAARPRRPRPPVGLCDDRVADDVAEDAREVTRIDPDR